MEPSIRQKMFTGILDWRQSGLTQKAWCEKNNIAYAAFHYWYKKFRSEGQNAVADHAEENRFVQLMVDTPSQTHWCELILPDGKKLIFHRAVTSEFIKSLIA